MNEQKQYRKYTFGTPMWVVLVGLFLISLVGGFLGVSIYLFVAVVLLIWDDVYQKKRMKHLQQQRHAEAKADLTQLLELAEEREFCPSEHLLLACDDRTALCIDTENKQLAMLELAQRKRVQLIDFRNILMATVKETRYQIKLVVQISGSLDDPFEVLLYQMSREEERRARVYNRPGQEAHSRQKVQKRGLQRPGENTYVEREVASQNTYYIDHNKHSKADKKQFANASERSKEWKRLLEFYIRHWNPNDAEQPHTASRNAIELESLAYEPAMHEHAAHAQESPSVSDELAKLVDLMEQGYITREEFEAQKKKILAR